MKAFDFFCGAGGATKGLSNAGIDVIAGIDIDSNCKKTYLRNNPNSNFLNDDIKTVDSSLLGLKNQAKGYNDLLFAACPPCQPFSTLNKNNSSIDGFTLLGNFGKLVESILPGYVLVENVPGLSKISGYSTFRRFINTLKSNNYKIYYDICDAKYFGVPQRRRRLILLASRLHSLGLPEQTHGNGSSPLITVKDAISHFPQIDAGESHSTIPNHVSPNLSNLNLLRLRSTPHDGGNRKSWSDNLKLKCHINDTGHTDVYGRMYWDKPAPTLTGRCTSISNGRYGHPEQDRAISLREAAALQSFDDNYVFYGSNTNIAQQIGNAVPVKLAESIGKYIIKLHNSI